MDLGLPQMSTAQWAALVVVAVLVFWMVGAYNRLVALRNAIGAAWQQIDASLSHRAAVMPALLAALREPLAGEQGALEALQLAHAQAAAAAKALGQRPVAVDEAAHWVQAESALASRASRVLALLEQQPQVRDAPAVAALLQTWREAEAQQGFARRLFDGAARAYNDAARQVPTRWLVRMYGFGPAGLVGG